ncbi:hypothetical protein RKE30_38650 [Streptomyces sp. Li-HN-5-11]|uniref:hypothetical protein n=1 Tax=Streptomyces sp. Li-HN-5-11 TaxID=3075432 RepID=UPI0028AEAA7D|nr:hypothetical protein [Streptomyces sp. Li-HN-5-11]WNM35858.1 hypothetical protein RKE30_38650 [Streptomyces sp. Li-HN-5-11]
MTTYHSDGTRIATGAPFTEARTRAADGDELLAEVWDSRTPGRRVAAAAFVPGQLSQAVIRHGGGEPA